MDKTVAIVQPRGVCVKLSLSRQVWTHVFNEREAAAYLRLHQTGGKRIRIALEYLRKTGRLRGVRIGNYTKYTMAELDACIGRLAER